MDKTLQHGVRVGLGVALSLAVGLVLAAEMKVPKVLSDAPTSAGQWRMEMLDVPEASQAAVARAGGGMLICQTAAKAMSRDEAQGEKNRCKMNLVEDSTSRAVMEMSCPDDGTANRTTITRVAPKSYEMTALDLKKPGAKPMRMRMTYVGACSEKDSVISMDKSSPACKQMRGRIGEMEKAKASCAKNPAQRAQCEQMVAQSLAQIQSMCGQ